MADTKYSDDALRVIIQDWDENDADQAVAINMARELLELRALSHAAGQEAEDEYLREAFDRFKQACSERGSLVTITKADACTLGLRLQEVLTPAQPPASAEVGRDAERYRWLRENRRAAIPEFQSGWDVIAYMEGEPESIISAQTLDAAIAAAMAAYSGRK